MFSPAVSTLIKALGQLPGIGPKTAQRLALYILEKSPSSGRDLASRISDALSKVSRCCRCRNLTETEFCPLCDDPSRDARLLCVVETPTDLFALEQSSVFHGRYFVLYGRLSPIDGIGPSDLGLDQLKQLVQSEKISEVIVATSPTVEGEATGFCIAEHLSSLSVTITRIAHGVPLGGDLGYVDTGTLAHALMGRKAIVLQH